MGYDFYLLIGIPILAFILLNIWYENKRIPEKPDPHYQTGAKWGLSAGDEVEVHVQTSDGCITIKKDLCRDESLILLSYGGSTSPGEDEYYSFESINIEEFIRRENLLRFTKVNIAYTRATIERITVSRITHHPDYRIADRYLH
jgi:hypothetical protein